MKKHYEIAAVHGMCHGVHNALEALEKTLEKCRGSQLYVLNELVHNKLVTSCLESRGVRFVSSPADIPADAAMVIGAHGVSAAVKEILDAKTAEITDTTCPLVRKLQLFAASLTAEDQLIIFGKAGHPEVVGVCGHSNAGMTCVVHSSEDIEALPELSAPIFISQTTVDAREVGNAAAALKKRFPQIRIQPGVCDASRRRQQAVLQLAARCEVVLIVGSAHSSNACRLREIAEKCGAKSFLIDGPEELPVDELNKINRLGLSSGASTPSEIFDKVVKSVENLGFEP